MVLVMDSFITLGQPSYYPDGYIIISDTGNNRVSFFTTQGKFVRHLQTQFYGLSHPLAMSISLPYLWLIDNRGNIV